MTEREHDDHRDHHDRPAGEMPNDRVARDCRASPVWRRCAHGRREEDPPWS